MASVRSQLLLKHFHFIIHKSTSYAIFSMLRASLNSLYTKKSVFTCQAARRHIPEDGNFNIRHRKKSHAVYVAFKGEGSSRKLRCRFHSVTCVQLRLITNLGNCGCVAVASFLGVPSPLVSHTCAWPKVRVAVSRVGTVLFLYGGCWSARLPRGKTRVVGQSNSVP
jgi:hypothetical protein